MRVGRPVAGEVLRLLRDLSTNCFHLNCSIGELSKKTVGEVSVHKVVELGHVCQELALAFIVGL